MVVSTSWASWRCWEKRRFWGCCSQFVVLLLWLRFLQLRRLVWSGPATCERKQKWSYIRSTSWPWAGTPWFRLAMLGLIARIEESVGYSMHMQHLHLILTVETITQNRKLLYTGPEPSVRSCCGGLIGGLWEGYGNHLQTLLRAPANESSDSSGFGNSGVKGCSWHFACQAFPKLKRPKYGLL